jgi:pyrroline-5-carboxylate reductase
VSENKKIGFIGGGMVAEAIIRGLILHGHDASKLFVSDPSDSRRDILSILNKQLNVLSDNQSLASEVDIMIMAIKPQIFSDVASNIDLEQVANNPMIISVAAGIQMKTMKDLFGQDKKICRVMPNTPCLVGRGVSTLIQSNLNESDIVMATYIFNSVGKTIWIQEEEWMHAVTAVSGSGPAYFFHMMHILSIQTAIGSSQLALNSADDLITLKKKVMSPGGTTEAAFDSLEKNKLDDIWDEAINAARQRSVDLGKD